MAVERVGEGGGKKHAALPVLAAAGFAILVWSGTTVVTRIIVGEMDPVMAGIARTVGCLAVTAPVILLWRLKAPRGAYEWLLLLMAGGGSFAAFPLLYSLGQARTSAAHAALILAAMPLFTGLAAAIVERRMPRLGWWLGAAIAFAGEGVLVVFRDRSGIGAATEAGDLLVLAAALASATSYVAGARLAARITPVAATFWTVSAAAVALLPAMALRWSSVRWSAIGWDGWAYLVYLSLGSTVLAFIAWYWALARGGIGRVAVLQFAQPVLSVLLAVAILGERMTPPLLVAVVFIIAGIAVARRRPS